MENCVKIKFLKTKVHHRTLHGGALLLTSILNSRKKVSWQPRLELTGSEIAGLGCCSVRCCVLQRCFGYCGGCASGGSWDFRRGNRLVLARDCTGWGNTRHVLGSYKRKFFSFNFQLGDFLTHFPRRLNE